MSYYNRHPNFFVFEQGLAYTYQSIYTIPEHVRELVSKKFISEHWKNFIAWSKPHLLCEDYDPIYPEIRYLSDEDRLNNWEDKIWRGLLFVACYSLPSSEYLFRHNEKFSIPLSTVKALSIGTERRGFRDARQFIGHMDSLKKISDKYGSLWSWLTHGFTGKKEKDFFTLQKNALQVYGNGVWAAHKTAELLEKTFDFPVKSSDMGGQGKLISKQPQDGLKLFYRNLHSVQETISASEDLHKRLWYSGICTDMGVVETLLCDFGRMSKGRYYNGKGFDAHQSGLLAAEKKGWDVSRIWSARKSITDQKYLGEFNNWVGVDKPRLLAYKYLHLILDRDEPTPEELRQFKN